MARRECYQRLRTSSLCQTSQTLLDLTRGSHHRGDIEILKNLVQMIAGAIDSVCVHVFRSSAGGIPYRYVISLIMSFQVSMLETKSKYAIYKGQLQVYYSDPS